MFKKVRTDFGPAPPGYIPGKGRGATAIVGGVSRDESSRDDEVPEAAEGEYDEFQGIYYTADIVLTQTFFRQLGQLICGFRIQ